MNHEAAGAELALECLDSISHAHDQLTACRYLLGLLNNVSGCSEEAKGLRRGASAVLLAAIQRGAHACGVSQ